MKLSSSRPIAAERFLDENAGPFGNERFWVHVMHSVRSGTELLIYGLVSNELVHTAFHGLRLKSRVAFNSEYVQAVVPSEEHEKVFGAMPPDMRSWVPKRT